MPSRRLLRRAAASPLRLLLAVAVLALAACASAPPLPPSDFLLLGEVHDNPAGHRARLANLQRLLAGGWRPVVVMEQFDREGADDLRAALTACTDADCVIRRAGPDGWDWPLYRPLIALALEYRLTIVGANVSRGDASRVVRGGIDAVLDAADRAAFGLPQSITPALREAQTADIEAGHCGKVPPKIVQGIVDAQIVRDIWMAKVMLANAGHGVVLLAGNGHVRRDFGVPYWLRLRGAQHVRAVGYTEDGSGEDASQYDDARAVPPHPRPDPCATLQMPAK